MVLSNGCKAPLSFPPGLIPASAIIFKQIRFKQTIQPTQELASSQRTALTDLLDLFMAACPAS